MHYSQLSEQVALEFELDLDDVIDDVLAVISRHRWNPTALTDEQTERVRFETIARAETINQVIELRDDD